MQGNFHVDVSGNDGAPLLRIKGELDLATSPELEEALERAAATSPSVVIIDLRELEFMDSTGLSVLIRAHHRAQQRGHRLAIVNGSRQVRRLLMLTGVADRLTVVERPEQLEEA